MTFKEKIVRLRKIKSLTQDEFASAIGVSRQAVYKWESGQSYPEVSKLLEIKLLFGISIDDLLDDNYEVEMPEKKKKKRISKSDRERIEAEVRAEEGLDAEVGVETEEIKAEETEQIKEAVTETKEEVKEAAYEAEKKTEAQEKKKGFFARLFSKK
jgi:transcriptional regulator with XRE-family HTH domain